MRKIICLILAAVLLISTAACTNTANNNNTENINTANNEITNEINNTPEPVVPPEYTLQLYSSSLAADWNPHTWKSAADSDLIKYVTSPLVDISIKDSKAGIYQWVYEMAESVKDVTESCRDDLAKYSAVLPEGQFAEGISSGYVYEIKLRKDAKWANGKAITADDYIYSMQQLLDPQLQNYRAERFVSGQASVAGGNYYFNSGRPVYVCMIDTAYGLYFDYERGILDGTVYINVDSSEYEFHSMSLAEINAEYSYGYAMEIEQLRREADEFGYTKVTQENRAAVEKLITGMLSDLFGMRDAAQIARAYREALFVNTGSAADCSFDSVGFYKTDDLTLHYVCTYQTELNEFLQILTGSWLVYRDYYEAARTGSGSSDGYCTNIKNTMSYGPYMLSSITEDKMELVQNPNWYGWEEGEDGTLVSYTNFEVDGEKKQQYRTTKIEISAMSNSQAERAFLHGELSEFNVSSDDYSRYAQSDKLYTMDETFTWSLFFNTNIAYLLALDEAGEDSYSIVLSDINFRKALSLCIDRAEFVKETAEYVPAVGLINQMYYYDVYNDPESSYRGSDEAMAAVAELYEVQYGEDKDLKTLKDAYDSVTGFDLEKAKTLMKAAHDQLVYAGRYVSGEPVRIRMAFRSGDLSAADKKQAELLNKYINAAAEDSGFGTITLEAVGGVDDRSGAVTTGKFAIGCGEWGGAALFPFRAMRVYCDPDQYRINEASDWDPKSEWLTMSLDGWMTTRTWQEWSRSIDEGGIYSDQRTELKLYITSVLEKEFLKKYFRIPVAACAAHKVLSYKVENYTKDYSILYGFGGMRLLKYVYNDSEWESFVEEHDRVLKYWPES